MILFKSRGWIHCKYMPTHTGSWYRMATKVTYDICAIYVKPNTKITNDTCAIYVKPNTKNKTNPFTANKSGREGQTERMTDEQGPRSWTLKFWHKTFKMSFSWVLNLQSFSLTLYWGLSSSWPLVRKSRTFLCWKFEPLKVLKTLYHLPITRWVG